MARSLKNGQDQWVLYKLGAMEKINNKTEHKHKEIILMEFRHIIGYYKNSTRQIVVSFTGKNNLKN